ncbi:MAG TPA: hypothetical protein VGP22_15860, partial [Albitalea sp.]|nr:hypothetical protein [Albitalea sp.]
MSKIRMAFLSVCRFYSMHGLACLPIHAPLYVGSNRCMAGMLAKPMEDRDSKGIRVFYGRSQCRGRPAGRCDQIDQGADGAARGGNGILLPDPWQCHHWDFQ